MTISNQTNQSTNKSWSDRWVSRLQTRGLTTERQAAERVAASGYLLITSHAAAPPWSDAPHGHEHRFLSPREEVEQLQLDHDVWDVLLAEVRSRQATAPDGQPATLDDVVVLIRRH